MRSLLLALFLTISAPFAMAGDNTNEASVERGRYLAMIGGCNDCHTAGFAMSGGKVPPSEWLQGDKLGYSGPWGTTYPSNLRLKLAGMDLTNWKSYARQVVLRPPMPYWTLNAMSDEDLEAIWRFTRSLGKDGEHAPEALPPGVEPPLPVFRLDLPPPAAASR